MGMPRLFWQGAEFPLKELSSKSFEFLRKHDFEAIIRPQKIIKGRLLVSLLVDAECLEVEVESIRRTLAGNEFSLFLFIVGTENEESFFKARELIEQGDFFCFYEGEIDKARSVCLDLAHSICRSDEIFTFFDKFTDKTRFKIGSFSTVTTTETKRECLIMMKSVRRFHQEPFFVICDESSEEYLAGKIPNLNLIRGDLTKAKSLTSEFYDKESKKCNDFHRPDAIFQKMEAMEAGIENCKSTFFLDADIVALRMLSKGFSKPTALSPHYAARRASAVAYGVFNAGYLYSCEKDFPDSWRELYLRRSKFYEQEGMRHLLNDYDCEIFGREHNVGFWRDESDFNNEIISFHAHLSPDLDQTAGNAVLNLHKNHRSLVREYIAENDQELDEQIRGILNE